MEQRIVEITEFSLLPGARDDAFLATAGDVNRELHRLRGFRYRHLLKSINGWTEVIEWDRLVDARHAAQLWPTLPGIADYSSMVATDTRKVSYHAIAAVTLGVTTTPAEMEF